MKKFFAPFLAVLASIGDMLHTMLFAHMANTGMVLGLEAMPTARDFNARRVTNPNQSEVVRQRFYDYILYPTAGVGQLSFFSNPAGQGITTAQGAVVGSTKTLWDTNLVMANTLPSGAAYMIESIEVPFWPGASGAANTFTLAAVTAFAAVAATAVAGWLNDVNSFYLGGMLELNILSKNYLRETPLAAFPSKTYFEGFAGVASNSATTGETIAANMRASGRPYYLEPTISLQPAVNFEVVLKWPAAVATPSGFNARVGVVLDGYFMRASQ